MTRLAYLFAALAGFLFLHRPLEGQARVARVLTAQDTAAIVKLARGLAIPGGSLDVGTIRVRGDTAVADVHVFTKGHGPLADQTLHQMRAVRRPDEQWAFQAMTFVSAATVSTEPPRRTPPIRREKE